MVADRKLNPKDGSYTNYLFDKGLDKILKNRRGSIRSDYCLQEPLQEEVVYETADLIYHLMVLLVEQGVTLDDIYDELRKKLTL